MGADVLRRLSWICSIVVVCAATLAQAHATSLVAQTAGVSVALLRLDDLPTGWLAAPLDPDEAEAMTLEDPCGAGPAVQPVDVDVAEFRRGDRGPTLSHTIARFAPGDAERALIYLRDQFGACGDLGPLGIDASPLPIPPLGDDSLALRLEDRLNAAVIQADVLVMRRADVLSILVISTGDAPEPFDLALLEALAGTADARLAQLVAER